jgi:SAM-dependent methyltransferase
MLKHVGEDMLARLDMLGERPAGPILQLGLLHALGVADFAADCSHRLAREFGGIPAVQCDEDRLPFGDRRFACILAFMTLHGVNDLPGALLLMRRALVPGGRLLAAFPAGFSLGLVREAFLAADLAMGAGVSPRLGPTVDPAEAAGLLQRAGFTEPVVEIDRLTIRTASLSDLARDLRAHGDTGWLAARAHGLTTPRRWAAAEAAFQSHAAPDGKVAVTVEILTLSGRVAPDPHG